MHYIHIKQILLFQDNETGGFADRPGNMPDPFHTLFGVAGLSLLGEPNLGTFNSIDYYGCTDFYDHQTKGRTTFLSGRFSNEMLQIVIDPQST